MDRQGRERAGDDAEEPAHEGEARRRAHLILERNRRIVAGDMPPVEDLAGDPQLGFNRDTGAPSGGNGVARGDYNND